MEKKTLNLEDLQKLYNEQEKDIGNFNIFFRTFKYLIIQIATDFYKKNNYNISLDDIKQTANEMVADTCGILDEIVFEKLKKYEKKGV